MPKAKIKLSKKYKNEIRNSSKENLVYLLKDFVNYTNWINKQGEHKWRGYFNITQKKAEQEIFVRAELEKRCKKDPAGEHIVDCSECHQFIQCSKGIDKIEQKCKLCLPNSKEEEKEEQGEIEKVIGIY